MGVIKTQAIRICRVAYKHDDQFCET